MTRKTKKTDKQKKPFDPWTATPEEREAVAAQGAAWAQNAKPGATLPADSDISKLLAWLDLKQIEEYYTNQPEELSGWVILNRLARCFSAKIAPPPDWLIEAFCVRESAISDGIVKKWDDPRAFGQFPKPCKQHQGRLARGFEIEKDIQQKRASGLTAATDRESLSDIAEQLNCSSSEAQKSLQETRKLSKWLSVFGRLNKYNK